MGFNDGYGYDGYGGNGYGGDMGYDGYNGYGGNGYGGNVGYDGFNGYGGNDYGMGYNSGYGNQGYDFGNQGYGYGQQGSVDRFGNVKYTKGQIIQGLRDYVTMNTGIPISAEEKIEDTPQLMRHACAAAKISQLGINYFCVPEMGLQIPFYFCTACGKLFYPKDFM